MLGQIGCSVHGREALLISLVDLCPVVEQVMHLQSCRSVQCCRLLAERCWYGMISCGPAHELARLLHAQAGLYVVAGMQMKRGTHHVQLLVRGGKVEGGASPVVLGHEVGVPGHDLQQLLRLAQAHS